MYAKSHALISPSLSTDIHNILLTVNLVKSDICLRSEDVEKSAQTIRSLLPEMEIREGRKGERQVNDAFYLLRSVRTDFSR